MPIIAKHHHPDHVMPKDCDYRPSQPWPEDATVQWGARGVVLGPKPYKTAFFEAFPKEAGFIRGEGETIADAERDAFARFQREQGCAHVWGRRGYTNGAGKCIRCNAFRSNLFHPVTQIGSWRAPISRMCLDTIIMGWLRRSARDLGIIDARHNRHTWLRARSQGIELPPIPDAPMTDTQFMGMELDPYRTACREAVATWLESDRCTLDDADREALIRNIEGHRQSDARLEAKNTPKG